MPRVIAALIRHGDYHQLVGAPSAHQPFALNHVGRVQAREGADMLRRHALDEGWELLPLVDSSRMLRAWETAEIMLRRLADRFVAAPGIESFDALAERGVGCAANLTVGQIETVLAADPRFEMPPRGWKSDSHYQLPLQGAESLLQAGERVATHITSRVTELLGTLTQDSVKLFVGHGGAFRHAAYHLGVLGLGRVRELSMYHGRPVYLELCADGSWRQAGGQWKLRAAGDEVRD